MGLGQVENMMILIKFMLIGTRNSKEEGGK